MTVEEIITEIDKLPSLYYEYYDDEIHMIILGGQSCPKRDEYINLIISQKYFIDMQTLYEKNNLTDDEKYMLAKLMKRIMNQCNYRHRALYSIKDQEEFLKKLDEEALDDIGNQIQMYKLARQYYKEFIYKK